MAVPPAALVLESMDPVNHLLGSSLQLGVREETLMQCVPPCTGKATCRISRPPVGGAAPGSAPLFGGRNAAGEQARSSRTVSRNGIRPPEIILHGVRDRSSNGAGGPAPGSNRRILQMTEGFLQQEMRRKAMFDSVHAGAKISGVDLPQASLSSTMSGSTEAGTRCADRHQPGWTHGCWR